MPAKERPHFDIEIQDLSEEFVDQCAAVHAMCFPEKIETLLGHGCIVDCLRRRYMPPHDDCFCRIAVDKFNRKLAGYCYAEPMRGALANAFLNRQILVKHLLRRVWFLPRVWGWILRRVVRSRTHRGWNEGDSITPGANWEVAKMMGLHSDYRGGNVGVDLMLDNEAQARQRGVKRICGLVERNNIKAERLYKSIGWARTSPDTDRYDVFAMHKDLETPA